VAKVVAGAANNPLGSPEIAGTLAARGVLYVPDFIANSGGIIHVGAEALGLSSEQAEELLRAAGKRAEQVLLEARETDRLPIEVAEELAMERLGATAEPAL
jgi:leucine dehydrogenase